MKLQAQTIETETEGLDDIEEFSMETTDPAVIQIMLENIYPDPYVWPRELLANWIDADPEGRGSLLLPQVLEPNWVIEDFGDGMDDEFMRKKYSKIFHSTKRDNNEKIGGFGHGRLSPLAYTDSYSVRSRFTQGGVVMEGNYLIYKGENKIPRVTPLSLGISEVQQTGVTVTIPIGDKDIAKITERTKFFASYLDKQPQGFEPVKYLYRDEIGGVRTAGQDSDMAGVRLIVGGVPYPAPRSAGLAAVPFDLFFETGSMSPTLDRGSINADATVIATIKTQFKKLIDAYRAGAMVLIDKEPSVLDKFIKYNELSSVLDYSVRNLIFNSTFARPSSLVTSDIFSVAKHDFNLHEFYSQTDKTAWRDLDLSTKTLKSLSGIRIKSLVGSGAVQRKSGSDLSTLTQIDFAGFVDRYGRGDVDPQIAIFAIKLPYVQGQIKLIKEAIAAELTKQREAKPATLGKNVKALLIQYEDEDDVKAIAKLIAPKLPVTIITDKSNRAAGSQYTSVIVASSSNYSTTKAIRTKLLATDSTMAFFIRPNDWKASKVNNVFDNLRRLKLFEGMKLVAVNTSEIPLLPTNYRTAEDILLKYIKKQGYPVDVQVTNAHMTLAQNEAALIDAGMLNYGVQNPGQSIYDSRSKEKLYEVIKTKTTLMADPVIANAIAVIESDKKFDVKDINEINAVASYVTELKRLDFFTKPLPQLTRPLPNVQKKDQTSLKLFSDKFPLILALKKANDYNYRNYGMESDIASGIIDYMESKQARNCN